MKTSSRQGKFTSVAHLLRDKPAQEHKSVLRHLCTVIFCNVEHSLLSKESGFVQFDRFFSRLEVSVESFSTFLNSLVKTKDPTYGGLVRAIESIVWDVVKFDFDHYNMDRLSMYRLFCLFNRFATSEAGTHNPELKISYRAWAYLAKELGAHFDEEAQSCSESKTIHEWLRTLAETSASLQVKKLYDKFVRDVIKEGRIKFRVLQVPGLTKRRHIQTVTMTSQRLYIYGDEDGDLDQPHIHEPTGRILFHLDLANVDTRVAKSSRFEKKNKLLLHFRNKLNGAPLLEMAFDPSTGMYDLYAWRRAVEEAHILTSQETTKLEKQVRRLNGELAKSAWDVESILGPSSAGAHDEVEARRSSDPLLQPLGGSSSSRCESSCSLAKEDSSSMFSFRSGEEDGERDRLQSLEPSPSSSLRRRALQKISASTTNLSAATLRLVLRKSRSGSFDVFSSNSGRSAPNSVTSGSIPTTPESIRTTRIVHLSPESQQRPPKRSSSPLAFQLSSSSSSLEHEGEEGFGDSRPSSNKSTHDDEDAITTSTKAAPYESQSCPSKNPTNTILPNEGIGERHL